VTLDAVRSIADAVLYEGYILYPYRASSQKNQSRWQFGVIMAPAYAAADPSETSFSQYECVLEHTGSPELTVLVRFLQVQRRTAGPGSGAGSGEVWDEAVEREAEFTFAPAELLGGGHTEEFTVPGGEDREPDGVVRRREPLAGAVTVQATAVPGPWRALRLRIRVENRTGGQVPARREDARREDARREDARREDALPSALVAAHAIVSITGGEFISMTDPPEWARPAVAACENAVGWPVLADPDGGRDVMLCSPIILYDHPELAPESAGELYDGTEIDEILTLRTLALTEEEKAEARATDPRAAALIDRVESMDPQAMARLHGTIRPARGGTDLTGGLGELDSEPLLNPDVPWWDPGADASVSPDTDSVIIAGQQVARGSRVRLRPGARRADAQDMFLIGRVAEVQAVLLDVDDKPYLAVSLADQPDEDIRIAHGRFLYFATDEVEPCEAPS
jgi:hypothetical protein